MALSEVNPRFIQQGDPGLHKRWFADEELDLTIWQEEDGGIAHFQLVLSGRDLVEWDESRGIRTGRLQSPEEGVVKGSRTYVLRAGRQPAVLEAAVHQLERQGAELEPALRDFVVRALTGQPVPPPRRLPKPPRLALVPPLKLPVPANQRAFESRVVSVRLMTPRAIRHMLALEAAQGWELVALGANLAVFQKEAGTKGRDVVYDVRRISTALPRQIERMLNQGGSIGTGLGGIGSNFIFFKRARNLPAWPREYRLDPVLFKSAASILDLLKWRSGEGWRLTGMGKVYAVFDRLTGAGDHALRWEHKSVGCPLFTMTPGSARHITDVADREAKDGWRPCALRAGSLYFRRPVE